MTNNNYLAHYGVKGMKWGVRKKADSLKKYAEKRRAEKENSDRTYYEGRYLRKGLSKKEASEAAQRRIERDRKVRKVVTTAAAVALTAAVAYAAYKKIDRDFLSVNLSTDIPLKNINPVGKGRDLDRHLYVTYKKSDTNRYRGLLANTYRENGRIIKRDPNQALLNGMDPKKFGTSVYETTLSAKTNIKAPSNRQAEKIYREFAKKNSDVRGMSYRMFNRSLVDRDDGMREKFFKEVSKKGYNAVIDTNDQWTSGYNTRKPIILINAGKVASEKHVTKLADSAIDKANKREKMKVYAGFAPRMGMQLSALGIGVTKSVRNDRRNAQKMFVDRYRKRYPKTKLTDAEISAKMVI